MTHHLNPRGKIEFWEHTLEAAAASETDDNRPRVSTIDKDLPLSRVASSVLAMAFAPLQPRKREVKLRSKLLGPRPRARTNKKVQLPIARAKMITSCKTA